jgi:hypothetical protein
VLHRELGTPKLKGLKHRQPLYEITGLRASIAARVS